MLTAKGSWSPCRRCCRRPNDTGKSRDQSLGCCNCRSRAAIQCSPSTYGERLLLGIGRIGMKTVVVSLLTFIMSWLRSRRSMQMEIVSLRHQLCVYQRSVRRPIIEPEDRVIWSWLARRWSGWKEALLFVQPRTVMAWQRKRFRAHWTKLRPVQLEFAVRPLSHECEVNQRGRTD